MATDMRIDDFAETPIGRAAYPKFGDAHPNFRIFRAAWLDEDRKLMKVFGAEFKEVLCGENRGQLSIKSDETERAVYVTAEEIDAAKTPN